MTRADARHQLRTATLAAMWAVAAPALAGQTIAGDYVQISYSDQGTWNWAAVAQGLQVRDTTAQGFTDVTWPGSPFQEIVLEYDVGAVPSTYRATYNSSTFGGITQQDLTSGARNSSSYVYTAGTLTIRKTEVWQDSARVVYVGFEITNTGASTVTNVRLMHGLDPDHEPGAVTGNDVTADGFGWVGATAASTGWTVGYGGCASGDQVGVTNWTTDADAVFEDPGGVGGDLTIHWRRTIASIAPGARVSADFVLAFDTSKDLAIAEYTAARVALCETCDDDDDGYFAETCGGSDCLDTSAAKNPGANEIIGDDVDQDCDLVDDCYQDLDDDTYGTSVIVSDTNLECDDATALTASRAGDNCPSISNSGQQNHDGDSQGDACDADDDNDGLGDSSDACDFSPAGFVSSTGPDYDADGCKDTGTGAEDSDDDNDGVADGPDPQDLNELVCGNADGDTCDDCTNQVDGKGPLPDNNVSNDGPDYDDDDLCDASDTDDDDDGVLDTPDLCDVAQSGTLGWTSNGTTDYDGDGCKDELLADEDADDDNDGVADGTDPQPKNELLCGNADADSCDDCTIQVDGKGPLADNDISNDGPDDDGDDVCDASDTDDDNDGLLDGPDACETGENGWTSNTTTDYDGDGCKDDALEDDDDDNDGVADGTDPQPKNELLCGNADADSCDDCTVQDDGKGPLPDNDIDDDGPDDDGDDVCDASDTDDDNDGVLDGPDACETGANGWTSNTTTDNDGDGCKDGGTGAEDSDDDNDGVSDTGDSHPLDPNRCSDTDTDTCDDCAVGVDDFGPLADVDPDDDGPDLDGDGACDAGDIDRDNDGLSDAVDGCPLGESGWTSGPGTDLDGDGCRDATEDLDDDDDTHLDADEIALSMDPLDIDSDADTIADWDELTTRAIADNTDGDSLLDALDDDSDGDGTSDADEAGDTDPETPPVDTDLDTVPDFRDTDSDGDGVLDVDDTCRAVPDPEQEDNEGDGLGDLCDSDDDDDDVVDDDDNCVFLANVDQGDRDEDGEGDACEVPDEYLRGGSCPTGSTSGAAASWAWLVALLAIARRRPHRARAARSA